MSVTQESHRGTTYHSGLQQTNEEELLTLPELVVALRRIGVVRRSRRTIYRWAHNGARTKSGERVLLERKTINGRSMSSVAMFRRFIDAAGS